MVGEPEAVLEGLHHEPVPPGGVGLVAATPTLYVFVREGYAPSGLQSAISVKASFDYMFGEQRLLYIPMFSLSLLYSSLVLLGPRVRPRAVPFAVALAVLLPMFGWSAEPRLLPFMLVAATVTAAAAIYELLSRSSFRIADGRWPRAMSQAST